MMSHKQLEIRPLYAALSSVLDHICANPGQDFAEADLVHGVVEHFGNNGWLWGPLLGLPDVPAIARMPTPGGNGRPPVTVALRGLEWLDALRAEFLTTLRAIVDGNLDAKVRRKIEQGMLRVVRVGNHYLPENLSAGLSFVLALLLDPAKTYGSDLRVCQLPECPRFFFMSVRPREAGKERVGVLPEKYCCPEHAKKAHNIVKSRWTQNRRKELKRLAAGRKSKPSTRSRAK